MLEGNSMHDVASLRAGVLTRALVRLSQKYSTAVDIWAAGCIFGELLSRKPMFPGSDYLEQLQLIVECIGACVQRGRVQSRAVAAC